LLNEASTNHQLSYEKLKLVQAEPASSDPDIETAKLKFSKSRAFLQNVKRKFAVGGYPEITLVAKGGGGGQPKANIC
jgi:hypothetical protein